MRAGSCIVVAALAVVALPGCGGEVVGNLFEVRRSGTIPGARLTLLVKDDGRVSCNGGELVLMPGELLLDSRQFVRDIEGGTRRKPEGVESATFTPGPRTVLSYRVRLADKRFAFSDTSRGVPQEVVVLQGLTRRIAKDVCGLTR